MLEVQDDLPVGPGGALGGVSGGDAGEDGDALAEAYFRQDAERLGYLTQATPGHSLHNGKCCLAKYYRDHGMLPPRYLDESVRQKELTGLDLDRALS